MSAIQPYFSNGSVVNTNSSSDQAKAKNYLEQYSFSIFLSSRLNPFKWTDQLPVRVQALFAEMTSYPLSTNSNETANVKLFIDQMPNLRFNGHSLEEMVGNYFEGSAVVTFKASVLGSENNGNAVHLMFIGQIVRGSIWANANGEIVDLEGKFDGTPMIDMEPWRPTFFHPESLTPETCTDKLVAEMENDIKQKRN